MRQQRSVVAPVAFVAMSLLSSLFLSGYATPASAEEVTLTYGPKQTAVKLTIQRPPGLSDTAGLPLIVALPPGAGNSQMVQAILSKYLSREASARGYVVVSPAIYGASLKQKAAAFVPALFAWIKTDLKTDPSRTALVGASNGGLGAFYIATAFPDRLACVATLPGALSGNGKLPDAFAGKPFSLYVGGNDRAWLEQGRRTVERLKQANADVELNVLRRQGHVVQIDTAELFDWIDSHTPAQIEKTPVNSALR